MQIRDPIQNNNHKGNDIVEGQRNSLLQKQVMVQIQCQCSLVPNNCRGRGTIGTNERISIVMNGRITNERISNQRTNNGPKQE